MTPTTPTDRIETGHPGAGGRVTTPNPASWPEPLASDVLDEIEAAIAAGRAMGHGASTILGRLQRLLTPVERADAGRFPAPASETAP